jgi:EmrB/QacA subfamily drug resistance transporter
VTTQTPDQSFLGTRRGKLTLLLLCAVAFIDFIDASIVNVALPSIQRHLHLTVRNLLWIPSGYLLTYGGFMLLGGRAADLLGRRRVLTTGTVVIAASSLAGGMAGSAGPLIAARMFQGVGAAMMLPAALSILTTTFVSGRDRHAAMGAWGGTGGLASAAGVFFGGVLTEGPGWRWVFWANLPVCALVLAAIPRLLPGTRPGAAERRRGFDIPGAVLVTTGMLLLVYALVKAPDQGWGSGRTVGELAVAGVLLVAFVVNEALVANPLMPLSIFRIRGLSAANFTQLTGLAGFLSMFFFVTLYMQDVLGYSEIRTGLAYLPVCAGVGVASGIASKLFVRTGTRPVIVAGALISAGGIYLLSRIPVGGSYVTDLLPGLVIMSFGLGAIFVGVTTAANSGVPADKAGLAAALLNTSQQLGGALGLAIFTVIATSRTKHELTVNHRPQLDALTAGFQRALLVAALFLLAAAVIGLRATQSRGETAEPTEPADGEVTAGTVPAPRTSTAAPTAARP